MSKKPQEVIDRTTNRVENVATRIVNKMMGKMLKRSLPDQVKLARNLMRSYGIIDFRANFLANRGLPADFIDLFKQGKAKEEIKEYYWSCPEFREFWFDLQCTEEMFDLLLSETAVRYLTQEKL